VSERERERERERFHMMMFLKIVVVMAMLSVAMSKFSIPSPLRVPSVGRSNSPPERRDLSSVELCTTETCGFDASAFDRAAVLKRSYSAGDPDIVFYWSFVGDDKIRIGVRCVLFSLPAPFHSLTHTHPLRWTQTM
jgi:hypothetical protein